MSGSLRVTTTVGLRLVTLQDGAMVLPRFLLLAITRGGHPQFRASAGAKPSTARRGGRWPLAGWLAAALAVLVPLQVEAQGLPLPRFAALRADEANVRVGPGTDYPIQWVFVRAGVPVEITAEHDNWRRIRDADGAVGWIHRSLLTGARTVLITGGIQTLRRGPSQAATPVAKAEPGVLGRLRECNGDWCRIEVDGHRGWLPRTAVWGVYRDETPS